MNLRMMAGRVVGVVVATAALLAVADPVRAAEQQEQWLAVVGAPTAQTVPLGTTAEGHERFRLNLRRPAPVTMFTDRPFRVARLVTPAAVAANWQTWFADAAPNAVMTFAGGDGGAPQSMVVELTRAKWDSEGDALTFTAVRIPARHDPSLKGDNWRRPATPAATSSVSLFIDSLTCCYSCDHHGC